MIDQRGRPSTPGPAISPELVLVSPDYDVTPDGNLGGQGHPEYLKLLAEIRELHLEKCSGYGTGSDPMANFTAVADASGEPRYVYAVQRAIEKLTRCLSLHRQGRVGELGEEFTDVASLALCAEAMRRSDTA